MHQQKTGALLLEGFNVPGAGQPLDEVIQDLTEFVEGNATLFDMKLYKPIQSCLL
jgi:hypothetical protein